LTTVFGSIFFVHQIHTKPTKAAKSITKNEFAELFTIGIKVIPKTVLFKL
jgi:hypothetical protein